VKLRCLLHHKTSLQHFLIGDGELFLE
jgi:hypothetical protein